MRPFSTFNISRFEWNPNTYEAKFHYSFDESESFTEVINFSPLKEKSEFPIVKNDENELKQLLAHLHLALGVSYYKLFPTKEILVHTLDLTQEQKRFWNNFYIKGLGEFFYRNQINPEWLAEFASVKDAPNYPKKIFMQSHKSLVLFGGGKDSLVTVELLKSQGQTFDLFSFWNDFPLHQIAQIPTEKKRLIIKRTLDLDQIKKLLNQGYYNGHLPITGIISFVSLVVSYLYGYDATITSLEKSADEGNTFYHGLEINHQRSKSSEFEQDFQNYVHQRISEDFSSYSLLRKRYEIRIIQEFCKYPKYFYNFSSCNRNFHQSWSKLARDKLWCWECPKCAFIYTMMRAFLGKEEVIQIFGKDLFDAGELVELFSELMGISGIKPFECVGTNEEMLLGLWLCYLKNPQENSKIMLLFREKVMTKMEESDFLALQKKLLAN